MSQRRRAAFTLVELLTVMTIIALLVALLIPAVMMARNAARTAQCINNQKQLAMAVTHYESAKGHFPGYANNTLTPTGGAGPIRVSWAVVLLPFLDRADLWEGPHKNDGWRNGTPQTMRVNEFVCPSDASNPTSTAFALSYAINVGNTLPVDGNGSQLGLFRDLCTDTAQSITASANISMTNVMASRRPMITDNPYLAVRNNHKWQPAKRLWTTYDQFGTKISDLKVTANQYGFVWPSTGLVRDFGVIDFANNETPLGTRDCPTNHSGISIVTFCDGHTDKLNDTAMCGDYEYANIQ